MYDSDIHQRRSIRLAGWDYRNPGAYFVTICAHERELLFCEPAVRSLIRNAWGRAICGGAKPPPYDFVVMPNHVHGIVWLRRNPVGARHPSDPSTNESELTIRDAKTAVGRGASPLRPGGEPRLHGPDKASLGALIGAFKSSAAKRVNAIRGTPRRSVWQRGYYERIVRDDDELEAVREYIRDNPAKWLLDPNNPANV